MLTVSLKCWGTILDELVSRGGLVYQKFSDIPFSGVVAGKENGQFLEGKRHGKWLIYYDTGQLRYEINYNLGKRDGLYRQFTPNGILEINGNYENGEYSGQWTYYLDGRIEKQGKYKDSLQTGIWKFWHPNGKLEAKGFYKNGWKDGEWIEYNEDGTIFVKTYWSDEELVRREFINIQ